MSVAASVSDAVAHRLLTAVLLFTCAISLVTSSSFSAAQTGLALYIVTAGPLLLALAVFVSLGMTSFRVLRAPDYLLAVALLVGTLGGLAEARVGTNLRYFVGTVGMWVVARIVFDTLMRRAEATDTFARGLTWSAAGFATYAVVARVLAAREGVVDLAEKVLFFDISTNFISSIFVVGTLGGIYLFFQTRRRVYLLCAIACLGAIVLGLSRGAFAAAVVGVVAFIALEMPRASARERRPLTFLIGGILVGTAGLVFAIARLGGIDLAVVLTYATRGFSGRDITWSAALLSWQGHPIVGYGLGSAAAVIAPDVSWIYPDVSTHSTWLRMLVETGGAGLVAYALALGVLIVQVWRLRVTDRDTHRRRNLLLSWLAAFLVLQTFDTYYLFGLGLRNLMYTIVFLLAWETVHLHRTRRPMLPVAEGVAG